MYIFYDTETTGLSRQFDQILQIALVFTDENFNILSRKKLECRRVPWVVPSPGAALITGFTPDDMKNSALSHFEMMKEVVDWSMAQHWPVTFAGFNTFNYDEGIMASNLEQCLLDGGMTTAGNPFNSGRNGRLDVMTVVKAVHAYAPGIIKVGEQNEFGSITFNLSAITRQNGIVLAAEDAHDAMNDIDATIAVANLVKTRAPDIWTQMEKMSKAAEVARFMAENEIYTCTEVKYGKAYATVAATIADGIVFDTSVDPAKYASMSVEQLSEIFFEMDSREAWIKGQRSKSGLNSQKQAARTERPFRRVNADEQPMLFTIDQSSAVLPKAFDEAKCRANAHKVMADEAFKKKVVAAAEMSRARLQKQQRTAATLPEEMHDLPVDPAVKPQLEAWKKSFTEADSWKERAAVVNRFYAAIGAAAVEADPTLRRFVNFAGRLVFEHAPEELSADIRDKMNRYIAARVFNPNPDAPYATLAKARKELDEIEAKRADDIKNNREGKWSLVTDSDIRALRLYYTAIEKEYAPFYTPPAAASTASPQPKPPQKGGGAALAA